jgi:hypothetical protein
VRSVREELMCLTLTLVSINGLCGQSPHPDLPKTVTEALDKSIAGGEKAVLAMAQAMPADRYSFTPTTGEFKGVRNFAQMVKHVAADNYVDGAALLGETPPVEIGTHENGPDSLTDKDAILKFVRNSFVYLHKAVRTVTEKNLMETVALSDGGHVTRRTVVMAASAHPWDLRGQMVEYLRMNGIDPQAAR